MRGQPKPPAVAEFNLSDNQRRRLVVTPKMKTRTHFAHRIDMLDAAGEIHASCGYNSIPKAKQRRRSSRYASATLGYSATPVETSEAEGGMGCLTCSFMSCR